MPPVPIREGAKQAVTRLRLSRPEGDLIVRRAYAGNGKTQLTVESPEGAKYARPQEMLDGLIGAIGFDPHAFTRLDQRKQAEQLRRLVGLDFSELQTARAQAYERRTAVNREVATLKAKLAALPKHDDAPEAEASLAELMTEMRRREAINKENAKAREDWDDAENRVTTLNDEVEQRKAELKLAQERLAQAVEARDNAVTKAEALRVKAVDLLDADVAEMQRRIESVGETNAKVRANRDRAEVERLLADAVDASEKLSAEIEACDSDRNSLMAAAAWPVEGLGFDEFGGVTFHGRPFAQASSAEQLRVSLAMGMALNPQLRVLIIRDGSLIDDDTMSVIRDAVAANDFQVWVEVVRPDGRGCSVVIEEGQVTDTIAAHAESEAVAT